MFDFVAQSAITTKEHRSNNCLNEITHVIYLSKFLAEIDVQ